MMLTSLIGVLRPKFQAMRRRGGYSLRTRLRLITGILALIPVLGLIFALVTMAQSRRDNAALDRAARGAIYLERINGLVYAVVMESRGIYTSADWHVAEPFAKNLVDDLPILQATARSWKADAVKSQQANVDDLVRHIDQYVQFRMELVRRGKQDGTAASREFGDNEMSRGVWIALNESLDSVTKAYEQEIGRARRKIEANHRRFAVALGVLTGFSFVVLCGGMLVVLAGLLPLVLSVKSAMLRLAQGDLTADGRDRSRAIEIAEMEEAIGVLRGQLVERDRLNREARLLGELNEWLQSCVSLAEIYEMIGQSLSQLLPSFAGGLYIHSSALDVMESTKVWNGGRIMPPIRVEDCWALRRSRPYYFGENDIDFPCAHMEGAGQKAYCCIPILAHGETIGLLHLEFCNDDQADGERFHKTEIAQQIQLALICAARISFAIANVKLRDRLRDQSIRDVMTGLYNRRYMLETCTREFSRAARARQPVGLLMIDIDHFKQFNDDHGHDAGDAVLSAVGGCLEAMFRDADVACRFGGEEFVVVLPGAELEAAARRAEEFRRRLEGLTVRYFNESLPKITVSIGVATFPEAGDSPQLVLKAADTALYRAKEAGRNRIELATPEQGGPSPAQSAPTGGTTVPKANADQPPALLVEAADG